MCQADDQPGVARSQKCRIYLVGDHPVTREGFARLINSEPDLHVCGQAGTAAQALAEIPVAKPHLVVVDISLPGTSGLELIKDIARLDAGLPVLVLSTHDEVLYAERALRAGARAYVMKHDPTVEVMRAIRKALRGGGYLSERIEGRPVGIVAGGGSQHARSNIERLSHRELEVFALIGEARTTRTIAASLHLAVSTVGTYRAKIKAKLGLNRSTELLRCAVEWVADRDAAA